VISELGKGSGLGSSRAVARRKKEEEEKKTGTSVPIR
jgi:hypothetical protein